MNERHQPPQPHASDEALSAVLDELGSPEVEEARAHVEDCEECAVRLDGLERARNLVAASLVEPVDDVTKRRLLAAALGGGAATSPPRARPSQRTLAWLAAAALVAALVGTTSLIGGDGDNGDQIAGPAGGADTAALPPGVLRGELGSLDDPATIRDVLAAGIHPVTLPASGGAGRALSGGGGSGPDGDGNGGAEGSGGGGEATRDDVASQGKARRQNGDAEAGAPPFALADPGAFAPPRPIVRCLERMEAQPAGDLVLAGTGTFEKRRAVVLAFQQRSRVVAVILARSDCSILSTQSFDAP